MSSAHQAHPQKPPHPHSHSPHPSDHLALNFNQLKQPPDNDPTLSNPHLFNLSNNPSPHLASSPSLASAHEKWYSKFKFSSVQLALLALLALQSVAIISILSATVAKIQKEIQLSTPQLKTVSTYLAIFIIANVFLIMMTIDLLLHKNVVQLIALCMFNISMAVYGAVLPSQIQRALQTPGGAVSWNGAHEGTSCNMYVSCYGVQYLYGDIKGWIIAIPVITGVVSGLMGWLTWLIYKEFGWEIFKLIGADLGLKRILQRKYLFHMLQKFVFFFFIGFSLQFLMLSSGMSVTDRVLSICAVPLSLAVIILGGIAVTNEIKWMMGVYYVFWTGAMIYFVYKLVKIYHNDSISSALRSLTIFSVLTIALLFATGVVSGLCYQQFGKGLLETPAGNDSVWVRILKGTIFRRAVSPGGNSAGARPHRAGSHPKAEPHVGGAVVDDEGRRKFGARLETSHGPGGMIELRNHGRMALD